MRQLFDKADLQTTGTKVAAIACGLLVAISIALSQEQVSIITSRVERINDEEYIGSIQKLVRLVPKGEIITTTSNVPQITYFTGYKVWYARMAYLESIDENFGRAIIQYMWNRNSSYLLLSEDSSFANYFASTHPYSSYPKTKVQVLDKLFSKIAESETETSIIHLYFLSPKITPLNLPIVTDNAWPKLAITSPQNGTKMELFESQSNDILVTGTAADSDSKVRVVEVSSGHSSFELATPKSNGDWSKWSYIVNSTDVGNNRIIVRATDNANHTTYQSLYLKFGYQE